jgi:hypothetical protein
MPKFFKNSPTDTRTNQNKRFSRGKNAFLRCFSGILAIFGFMSEKSGRGDKRPTVRADGPSPATWAAMRLILADFFLFLK